MPEKPLVWPNRTDETQSKGRDFYLLFFSNAHYEVTIQLQTHTHSCWEAKPTEHKWIRMELVEIPNRKWIVMILFFVWMFAILASRGLSSITCLRFCCSFVRSNVLFSQIEQHSLRECSESHKNRGKGIELNKNFNAWIFNELLCIE